MIAPRILVPPMSPSVGPLAATPAAFSEQSLSKLSGVNPLLAEILKETERRALERGIKLEVSEGLRDPARQAELVSAGKSQTLNSRHLTGNAIDVHIRNPDGSPNWDFEAYRPVADIAKQVAADMGVPDLTWGGDWKTLKDGVHFQLGGTNAGGVTMSTSGGQGMGLMDFQEEPKGFMGRLTSPDARDAILLWLNSMRLNPDQGLGQYVQARQEQRSQESSTNRTAQWLMSQGREDLARALMSGAIDPKTAASVALSPADKPNVMEVGGKLVDETGRVIYDPTGGAAPTLTSDQLSSLNTLRDDATTTTAELRAMSDAWTNINTFYQNPGAVSDRALVIAFAKILDPTSVVRESESAAIANSGSLDEGMKALLLNALQGGGGLPPAIRDEIVGLARDMYGNKMPSVQERLRMLQDTAARAGLPPELVFPGQLTPPPAPTPTRQGPPPPAALSPGARSYITP